MFNKSFGTPFGGSTGGFGTTSTFGQNTGFGTTSGGAFGTSAFGSSNNTGGLFGNSQTKPGGLFGTSSFSQPATSTSTGFGFGTSTGTSNSLFGTASTGTSLFYPRTMHLHKINQLALGILEPVLAVEDSLELQIPPLILLVAHLAPFLGQVVLQQHLQELPSNLILPLVQILWSKLELALTSVQSISVLLL